MTHNNTNTGDAKMTYGIKYEINGSARIMTEKGDWMSHRFVGLGGFKEKEWKTRKGAERAAARHLTVPAEVFEISNNVMNY